jgi:sec-independent protein translocase protein TatA
MFRNGLEPWHVILVVVVFVLLFGYKKMPDAARGLGKSLRILKSETRALREEGKDKDSGSEESASGESTAQRSESREALEHRSQAATEHVKDEQHTA